MGMLAHVIQFPSLLTVQNDADFELAKKEQE